MPHTHNRKNSPSFHELRRETGFLKKSSHQRICADQYQDINKTPLLVLLISMHCEELFLAHILGSLHNPWDKLKNAKTTEQKEHPFLSAS